MLWVAVVPRDPYQISNCTDLQNINNDLTAYYVLAGNIDCSATSGWNSGAGFVPIGSNSSAFKGNFNGEGYTISGLYISLASTRYVGLFGYALSATVTSVTLSGATVTGGEDVGGLVGDTYTTTVSSSSVLISTITATSSYVGGLLGYEYASTLSGLTGSSDTVSDSASSTTVFAGGIIGDMYSGTLTQAAFTGSVSDSNGYRVGRYCW